LIEGYVIADPHLLLHLLFGDPQVDKEILQPGLLFQLLLAKQVGRLGADHPPQPVFPVDDYRQAVEGPGIDPPDAGEAKKAPRFQLGNHGPDLIDVSHQGQGLSSFFRGLSLLKGHQVPEGIPLNPVHVRPQVACGHL